MIDGTSKVTGAGLYVDDMRLPGMLTGLLLRSPVAHARIRRINCQRALEVPGVRAIITGTDTPIRYGVLPVGRDETALATDKVRYIGEAVAAVAATSEEAAEQALARIEVDYEELPVYSDIESALKIQGEGIHTDCPNNIRKEYHHHFGDVQAGFKRAQVIVAERFVCPQVTHAAMEPHSTLAQFVDGKLTVWSSTQTPYYLHRTLSACLDLPMSRIRVIKPLVGGGFGGKDEPLPHEIVAAALSVRAAAPVKITVTREEVFYLHRGRPEQIVEMKLGLDGAGRITAAAQKTWQDGGAYCSFGVVTILYSGALLAAIYDIPNIKFDGYRVLTNRPPSGAMRGHGTVNTRFAFESVLDMAAEKLGIDPADVRLRNQLEPFSRTVNDLRITSYGYPECIRQVVKRSGWAEKWGKLPDGQGVGIAGSHYVSGAGNSIIRSSMPHSTILLKMDIDAGVTLFTGASEIGQGSDTMQVQIAAEVLGIPIENIRLVAADSDLTPVDLGSYSSRVTFMAGNAALRAAEDLKAQLFRAGAELLGAKIEALDACDEEIFVRSDPERRVSYSEAVVLALAQQGGTLVGKGSYAPPEDSRGGNFRGAGVGPSPAYSYSAQVAQVRVDVETGVVTVLKVWAAHDCGRALNPLTVEGQIEGSVWMGLGQALQEETLFRGARVMNPGLLEYKVAGSLDSPDIESIIVESHDPEGPFGAKECGEGSLAAVIPAVANAIYDAVGIRLTSTPFTPEKVLRALAAQQGRKWP